MRVVIAEDSTLLREGLVRLLTEYGAEVVAAVGTGPAVVPAVNEHHPDLVVLDVRMPPTHTDEGLVAALDIRERWPDTAILVLSQYVEAEQAGRLLSHGGGIGYLLKDHVTSLDDLATTIERLLAGETVLDPEVVSVLFTSRRQRDRVTDLTPREREVLSLMAEGRSNGGIGRALFITDGVVEKHIAAIMTKLDLPASADDNRRILAVLAWLEADGSGG
jgi:DNA-binding NarL/FixJ family response regulator